jgi:hypothetical protein
VLKHALGHYGTFVIHACTFLLFLCFMCCSFQNFSIAICNEVLKLPTIDTRYWILGWNSKSYDVYMWMCIICSKLTICIKQCGCIIYNINSMKHVNGIHLKAMRSYTLGPLHEWHTYLNFLNWHLEFSGNEHFHPTCVWGNSPYVHPKITCMSLGSKQYELCSFPYA